MSFKDVKISRVVLMDKQIYPELGKSFGVGAMEIPAGCPIPVEVDVTNNDETSHHVWLGSSMKNAENIVIVGITDDPVNPTHIPLELKPGETKSVKVDWKVPKTEFGQRLYVRFSIWNMEPLTKNEKFGLERGDDVPFEADGNSYWLMVGKQGLVADTVYIADMYPVSSSIEYYAPGTADALVKTYIDYISPYVSNETILAGFYNEKRNQLWLYSKKEVA